MRTTSFKELQSQLTELKKTKPVKDGVDLLEKFYNENYREFLSNPDNFGKIHHGVQDMCYYLGIDVDFQSLNSLESEIFLRCLKYYDVHLSSNIKNFLTAFKGISTEELIQYEVDSIRFRNTDSNEAVKLLHILLTTFPFLKVVNTIDMDHKSKEEKDLFKLILNLHGDLLLNSLNRDYMIDELLGKAKGKVSVVLD